MMDFIDRIRQLAAQIPNQRAHIKTEEATKTALIMPFINALGYNVFDPSEVTPELIADMGTKKGEKVDYAILKDGKPIMLFECKCCGTDLNLVHASQLFRYFAVTDARFGILTDGIVYHFFSDLDKPNKMDDKPFLIIDLLNFDERLAEELKKFTKAVFNVDDILTTANDLKYRREILQLIDGEFKSPSAAFVKHFANQVYSGHLREKVVEEFTRITKQALQQFINDQVNNRLQTALDATEPTKTETPVTNIEPQISEPQSKKKFTEDEREGYLIVKSILRETTNPSRISFRDTNNFCGILLDDTNRKPICRLYFNDNPKQLGLFDENKNEQLIALESLDELYKYADRLKATVARMNNSP